MPLKPLLYTKNILFSEYLFACREEIDLEGMLIELLASPRKEHDSTRLREIEAARAALLEFDRLCAEPERKIVQVALRQQCEAESKRCSDEFAKDNPNFARIQTNSHFKIAFENAALFENYERGLRSPDPIERAKFQDFERAFVRPEHTLSDILPALRLFVSSTKQDGRPTLTPSWRNIDAELKEIRSLIASGETKLNAVRKVATTTRSINGTGENKRDRLRKAYSAKMKLRE